MTRHRHNKQIQETTMVIPAAPFRGYTLEEIRYRRMVNGLKIEVAKERLMLLTLSQFRSESDAVSGAVTNFQQVMKWADIALAAYSVGRRVFSFFRRFRNS